MTTPQQRAGQSPLLNPVVILAAIMVVATLLRLFRLGALGIVADEDISILAIDGILEHGYPLLPSGMIYLRLGWYGYVVAAFGYVFGHEEIWLRLPAVLFNLAAIPLAYWFVARLFSKPLGLVVAALVALSPAEIEIARLVRMYSPFAFFYLLTALAIYRRYIDHTAKGSVLPIVLALVTVITHQLGFSLAIVFLVPLLIRPHAVVDRVWLLASAAITGVSFLVWDTTISRYMTIHVPPGGLAEAESALPSFLGPIGKVLGLLATPPFAFVADLIASGSVVLLIGAAALLAVTAGGVAALHRREPTFVAVAAVACVLAAALQQINIAVILMLPYLIVARRGIRPLVSPGGLAVLGAIGVWFTAWLAYAYYFTEPNAVAASGLSTHLRQSIRTLLDFPQYNVMWGLFFEMPLASIAAALGLLWCVDGAARRDPDAPRAFLLYTFVLPLIVSGMIATTYRELRYVMHFDVFFLTFIALGIWHWRAVLEALGWTPTGAARDVLAPRAATVALALLAFAYIPGPAAAWIAVNREHGMAQGVDAAFKLSFYPDFRTAAEYVQAHRDPTREPLIALQPREFYTYLRDVDYWLTTHEFETENHAYAIDDQRRDLYVDVPIISTMAELEGIIARAEGAVWLLAPDDLVASRTTLTEDLATFIEGLDSQVVYTGLDQDMRVYRLERNGH
jgi:uncharacterized membrane protein